MLKSVIHFAMLSIDLETIVPGLDALPHRRQGGLQQRSALLAI